MDLSHLHVILSNADDGALMVFLLCSQPSSSS